MRRSRNENESPPPSFTTMSQRTFSGICSHSHLAPCTAPASSSAVTITSSSPDSGRQPPSASEQAAAISAATCDFMSSAPRPQTQPSRSSPDHGSTLQSDASASTVSTCPRKQRPGPSERPRRRATRFGRSGSAASSSHSKSAASSISLRNSCAARSLPGGFTVLNWISRWSSSVVRCSRSGMFAQYRRCQNSGVEQLFDAGDKEPAKARARVPRAEQPLPVRMRPAALDRFVGQEHILGEDSALRRAIEEGRPHSMILYGPPGTGKTTLARMLATNASAAFEELSAVEVGRQDVRELMKRAEERVRATGQHTIFFLDEIHRFNKAQQDALLPAVEEGLVTLVGATTENPYFEVNSALISRCRIYELRLLSDADVRVLLERALSDGIEDPPQVEGAALDFLAARSAGDARTALAALEVAADTADDGVVTLAAAEDALQRKAVLYDKGGDRHYDTISAWIKATRGSDPDASLLYLAAMLEGGEDPRFIARRMVVLASEDIGNADPRALQVAVAAAHAVEHVGLPEAALNLAQASVYLALAPKSNASYAALKRARQWVRENGPVIPPAPLQSAAYPGAKALGRGKGYDYPHDRPEGVSPQELMPQEAEGVSFLELSDHGEEAAMKERLEKIKRARKRNGERLCRSLKG